ncbi:arsenic transporter [Nocardioides sp. HDW12B]|nr:arsenic transporter [Nocardioides sp. HDW12B]
MVLLAATLVAAVLRPHRLPEAVVAVGAAAVVLGVGAVDVADAEAELERLAPVVAFLAALLVLARLCADEGVFEAAGRRLVRGAGVGPGGGPGGGPPDGAAQRQRRFLTATFVVGTLTTLALSLDATAVLLTPTVLVAARRAGLRPRASVHLVGHLTNSASLLLPVANLTNLLALATLTGMGVGFLDYVALMALPALVVLAVELVGTRRFFRAEEPSASPAPGPAAASGPDHADGEPTPWPAIVLLGLTLGAIAVTGSLGLEPVWAATAGALVLAVHALARGRTRPATLARALDVPFLVFVAGLTVVVRAVVESRVGEVVHALTPSGEGLLALLGFTFLGAVLANLANNLPALLVLLVPAAAAGPLAVLAVLIGVNVGPNLTYVGSLATLLWRRSLRWNGEEVAWGTFLRHGLLTVPAQLLLGTLALWAAGLVLRP